MCVSCCPLVCCTTVNGKCLPSGDAGWSNCHSFGDVFDRARHSGHTIITQKSNASCMLDHLHVPLRQRGAHRQSGRGGGRRSSSHQTRQRPAGTDLSGVVHRFPQAQAAPSLVLPKLPLAFGFKPSALQTQPAAACRRGAGGQGLVPRQGSCGVPLPPGRRRESFLDKIKRAASQPALAAPSGPSLASLADTAIASVKRAPPQLGCARFEMLLSYHKSLCTCTCRRQGVRERLHLPD